MSKIEKLEELKHAVEERKQRNALPAGYPPSFLAGFNPVEAEYEKPDSTQGMDVIPKNVNKRMLPVYLPVSANDKMPGFGDKPVHSQRLLTRKQLLEEQLIDEGHGGGMAANYRFFFFAWVFLAATAITALFVNVYVAAVPAFLAGHNWSQFELHDFWAKQWFKTKPLIYAQ